MLAVSERRDQFGDATIAVVTFAAPERLAAHRLHLGIEFPVLADPERRLYALVGAHRAPRRHVWSLGTLRLYARLIRQGRRPTKPTEDVHQLGADVVIGRDGRVRYLDLPPTPASRPPIDELIAALD